MSDFLFIKYHPISILFKRAYLELHDQCVVSVAFELFNEYMYICVQNQIFSGVLGKTLQRSEMTLTPSIRTTSTILRRCKILLTTLWRNIRPTMVLSQVSMRIAVRFSLIHLRRSGFEHNIHMSRLPKI